MFTVAEIGGYEWLIKTLNKGVVRRKPMQQRTDISSVGLVQSQSDRRGSWPRGMWLTCQVSPCGRK